MTIDHLIVGAASLDAGIDYVAEHLGAHPEPGGRHPAWGTHNALLSLGPDVYLEVLAPDPAADAVRRIPMGLDSMATPRLVSFAVAADDLEAAVAAVTSTDVDLGSISEGRRSTLDGLTLVWRLTDPGAQRLDGIIPFVIDWTDTPHPATTLRPSGVTFRHLRAEHPQPRRVRTTFDAMGIGVDVTTGIEPRLIATLDLAGGPAELR